MKLSRLIFLGGLSSLALSGIVFWQRSDAAPRQQPSLIASAIQPALTSTPIATTPLVPVQPATPAQPVNPTSATPSVPAAPTASLSPIAQANLRTIATCNGQPGNANFRSAPSLAPVTVLGVIAQGEAVALTGRTAIGDGEFWYEAIAPSPLYPSTNPAALNRTQAGQTGWVSACFVNQ